MNEPDPIDPQQPVTQTTANRLIAAINALRQTIADQLTAWRPIVKDAITLAGIVWLAIASWRHGDALQEVKDRADSATTQAAAAADVGAANLKANTAAVQTLADQTGNPVAVKAAREANKELANLPATQKGTP